MNVTDRQPPSRLTPRGAATRARIVEAAANLVGAHGVGGTSLDDVMAMSGASKSQIYHYFPDKDALIRDVIGLQTRRVLAFQRPHLETLDSMPALRRWRDAMVEHNAAVQGRGGCPVGSLANELADGSEAARGILVSSFEAWEGLIREGLKMMGKRGEFSAGTDVNDLAVAVLAAIQGGLLLAKTTRSARSLELALDMALEHVERHLA